MLKDQLEGLQDELARGPMLDLVRDLRKRVLNAAMESARRGLIRGTSGNVSARDPKTGLIAITPSGIPYEILSPEDLPIVDVHGEIIDIREGRKPSSETPLHTEVYQMRPDVNGIVHTHSIYGTVFSVLNEEIPTVTVPLAMYGPVPVAPFSMPGSRELAIEAARSLGPQGSAVLLQNHGVLCVGRAVEAALACATYVEEGAQVAYLALVAGKVSRIPKEAVLAMKANGAI